MEDVVCCRRRKKLVETSVWCTGRGVCTLEPDISVSAPVSTPVSTPVSAPVSTPVSAPVSAGVPGS